MCVRPYNVFFILMKPSVAGFLLVLALGIALGAGSAAWWTGRDTNNADKSAASATAPEAAEKAVAVEVTPVHQLAMPRGVSAVGRLRSKTSVILRPEITGRI